jgi:hypothetical protein
MWVDAPNCVTYPYADLIGAMVAVGAAVAGIVAPWVLMVYYFQRDNIGLGIMCLAIAVFLSLFAIFVASRRLKKPS